MKSCLLSYLETMELEVHYLLGLRIISQNVNSLLLLMMLTLGIIQYLVECHRDLCLVLCCFCYVNDMPNSVPGTDIRLFADDTNIFLMHVK